MDRSRETGKVRSLSLEACMAVAQESRWVCRPGTNNPATSSPPLYSLSHCTVSFVFPHPPVCVSLSLYPSLHLCLFPAFSLSLHLCVSVCLSLSLSSSISVSLAVSASSHLFPLSPSLCPLLLLTSPPASALISLLLHTVLGGSRGCRQIICPVGSLPGTVWAVADKAWGGWGRCPVTFQSQSGRGTALAPRALASYCSCSLCFPGERCAWVWITVVCLPVYTRITTGKLQ